MIMENQLLLVVLAHYIITIEVGVSEDKQKEYSRYIDELTNIFIGKSYIDE